MASCRNGLAAIRCTVRATCPEQPPLPENQGRCRHAGFIARELRRASRSLINADTQTQTSLLLKLAHSIVGIRMGLWVWKTTYSDIQDNLWGHRRQLMGTK